MLYKAAIHSANLVITDDFVLTYPQVQRAATELSERGAPLGGV